MAIKILILDDEREILNALKRLLKLDERFEPYVTTDPEKALNILKKENIQVVMSDIVMPEMNGIEFLEKAKEINGLVQVIMMSAYSTVERVLACLERGASDYIMKPFSDDEVRSVLDDIVRRLERWRRLVVLARGATLEARKQVGSEGPSTGLDATPQINEAATDSTTSPLNMVEERLIHLKEKYGNDHESLGVAIIKSIEQEENQLVREQLSMELGEVLREHPSEELLERVLISRDAYLRNMAIAIARELGEKMISTLEGLIESEDKDVRKLVLDIAS
ncbi:MAG TPA: response regulator, partial [Dissulfuribacter thermophilus]|nr:response regulator [Dissulfuribacter thermophilus]